MTVEEWRDIPGWEGFYQVSDLGRVKSLTHSVESRPGVVGIRSGRIRNASLTKEGYPVLTLSKGKTRKTMRVHQLVLLAFIGPRQPGMEGCHNDGDVANNTPSNLRWDTRSANMQDRIRHGHNREVNKTHCPRNHPYDEANTYLDRGHRVCRKCVSDHARAKRELVPPNPEDNVNKTHCPQGHPYDEVNTYVTPSRPTARYCRACAAARYVKRNR